MRIAILLEKYMFAELLGNLKQFKGIIVTANE